MLCLNVDGTGFTALGAHDRVVETLEQRFPGLRPVLFSTPFEAAAWTIISQRIRMTQAATIEVRLANEFGEHGASPAPARLTQLTIGPFSAELILIRGAGHPDALPDQDTRLDDAIRSAYDTSENTRSDRSPTAGGERYSLMADYHSCQIV